MKKILILVIACVLCLGMVGGAFAWFSDTETSEDNTFTAGTLDLQLNDMDTSGWVDTPTLTVATVTDMAPGVEVGPFNIGFKNAGTVDGKVRVTVGYGEYVAAETGEFAGTDVSGEDYAKALILTKAYVDGGVPDPQNKAPGFVQAIIDSGAYATAAAAALDGAAYDAGGGVYYPTIYGLSLSGVVLKFKYPTGYPDPLLVGEEVIFAGGESHYEELHLMLDPDADNDYQCDGVSVDINAELIQYEAP